MNSPSIIFVRHCQATGQEPEAELTIEGREQSLDLSNLLSAYQPKRIVSSPFTRARESIKPLAESLKIVPEIDQRLAERNLGVVNEGDWRSALRRSFDDMAYCLTDGESSNTAMLRGRAAIDDILVNESPPTIVVSHGNLLSLIAKSFDSKLGYEFWEGLKNPDIFLLLDKKELLQIDFI
jgi:2,3-bisphosphoglycerate-dependent phosphoglycerate mutase